MVIERESFEGFLRELETTLPVIRSTSGSYFTGLQREVIPVYNVGAYDPGSTQGTAAVGAADYGLYGAVLRVERAFKTVTIAGVPGKPEFTMTPPPGEVHIYQALTVLHDQGANVDFFAEVSDVLIPASALPNRWRHGIVTSAVSTPLLRLDNQAKSVDDLGPGPYGPFIVPPLFTLTVSTTANMSTGKKCDFYMQREVYKTVVIAEDQSIAVTAAQV